MENCWDILEEVYRERKAQDLQWGEQNHPDGTGGKMREMMARIRKEECDTADKEHRLTFLRILEEEVSEAFAEMDVVKLREELIQVAAVAVCWIESIDRRK